MEARAGWEYAGGRRRVLVVLMTRNGCSSGGASTGVQCPPVMRVLVKLADGPARGQRNDNNNKKWQRGAGTGSGPSSSTKR